ncbi:hypothetical protein Pla123a_03910 [Posidoniimonas polymericola]|uniref:Uncharacterized protein n=1 Tax=Posidoniimonas polymericola TaxID=2528002 RepID=A0A5C5ZE15_9BACT|nr:hypothetical protein [Posidoniimonas polymericola]TWT85584.1 hypothetical protein Pla123a_03910 [Posidoniimonas polymericola]
MPETSSHPNPLQEFVDSRDQPLRLDRAASVLRGVKLLGLQSRNQREYREDALRRAMTLYEGARVNVNHPAGDPLAPRDYRDRLGVIRGVELRTGEGLFGSLHFNPKHPLAEQLAWDAEHAPHNVGLSHNVLARTSRHDGRTVVESIEHVQSVDLVADPASTAGLFEHQSPAAPGDTNAELEQQVAELTQAVERAEHSARVYRLLAEHGLRPSTGAGKEGVSGGAAVSEAFIAALHATRDPAALEQLVVDRARLLDEATRESFGPMTLSREQPLLGESAPEPVSTGDFVRAITRSK